SVDGACDVAVEADVRIAVFVPHPAATTANAPARASRRRLTFTDPRVRRRPPDTSAAAGFRLPRAGAASTGRRRGRRRGTGGAGRGRRRRRVAGGARQRSGRAGGGR